MGAVSNIVLMAKTLPQTRYVPQLAPGLLPYAIPVGASEIITALTGMLALSLLQARAGAQAVGLYGAAISIATLLHIIPQMVFAIFLPIASERHAQKRTVAPVYMKLLGWLAPAVFVPALILFSIRSPLIILLIGQTYQKAGSILGHPFDHSATRPENDHHGERYVHHREHICKDIQPADRAYNHKNCMVFLGKFFI